MFLFRPTPIVSIEPDKQTVPQGSSAMIRCSTNQPGVRIRWSKREDTMPPHIQVCFHHILPNFQHKGEFMISVC